MSEGKGAKEPTSVPPSFIPSSGRKKTMPSTDSSRSQSAPSQPASFAPAKRSRPCIIRKTGQTHGASFFLGSAKLPACGTGNERDKKKPFIISGVLRSRTYPHGQSNAAVPGVILRLHGAPICSILSSDGFRAKKKTSRRTYRPFHFPCTDSRTGNRGILRLELGR